MSSKNGLAQKKLKISSIPNSCVIQLLQKSPGRNDDLSLEMFSRAATKHHLDLPQRKRTMIVTDKFVFVHLPRSGGTFTSEVIKRFFPSAQEIGYHLPRTLLPAEYSHLP